MWFRTMDAMPPRYGVGGLSGLFVISLLEFNSALKLWIRVRVRDLRLQV